MLASVDDIYYEERASERQNIFVMQAVKVHSSDKNMDHFTQELYIRTVKSDHGLLDWHPKDSFPSEAPKIMTIGNLL